MFKYFILTAAITMLLHTTPAFAQVTVWSYDSQHEDFVQPVSDTINTYVPQFVQDAFNAHSGEVVISPQRCDPNHIAGLTTGIPQPNGWYNWVDDKTYMELTPTYGIDVAKSTVLHEFGHVLDMHTHATDDVGAIAIITAELPNYQQLVQLTGEMIPECKDAHELFAQVFGAVISKGTGTMPYDTQIMQACPNVTNLVKSKLYVTNHIGAE